MSSKKIIIAAASALALGSSAQAALVSSEIFFAEDLNPVQTVTTAVSTVRDSFLGKLVHGVGSYGFEDKTANLPAGPVIFNNAGANGNGATPITATILGSGTVRNVADLGRFNTTPNADCGNLIPPLPLCSRFLEVDSSSTGSFSIEFDNAISAFGFYGTDIGDFEGSLTAFLTNASGAEERYDIRTGAASTANNGALLFWGFASRTNFYTKIRFLTASTPGQPDFYGFDDFVVADLSQVLATTNPNPGGNVPEPASLALVGLGLLGAAAARRRRG